MNKKLLLAGSILTIAAIVLYFSLRENTSCLKKYYPDTKQTDLSEYIIRNRDTILHGKFTRYNEKGNKVAEGNFVNGEPTGKSIYYFDNGTVESIFYRKNSKITEENIDNFPSGKIMRYTSYDDKGLSAFIIRFDENGNVENYEGYPIIETYQYQTINKKVFKIKTNKNPKTGDTLQHQYLIADIPNAKRTIRIGILGVNDAKAKRTFKKISKTGLDVQEILAKKGVNTIQAIVKYEFNDRKKTVINDTISFKIMVN